MFTPIVLALVAVILVARSRLVVSGNVHIDINNDAEIANIRLVSLGIVDKPDLTYAPENSTDVLAYRRSVWFDGCWTDCPVYDRVAMEAGFEFEGPAIVEEAGGTSVVPPGWRIEVLASGTLDCRYRFTP